MLAGAREALLGDERVQPLDRRTLRGIGADVQDLGGESLGEALQAAPEPIASSDFSRGRAAAALKTSGVTRSGCMIISVQSHADLSSVVNVDMSDVQKSPSSGITP